MSSAKLSHGERRRTIHQKKVKKFKENNERVRYLTEEEEIRLNQHFPEEHWPKVEIAIHTGLRRAEQFNLRWLDINFKTRIITVRESKSGEARHVSMNDRALEILRSLPSRLKSDWVFSSETGKTPLNPNNFINRVFAPALKKAKIEDFHWHDLRHTFASRLTMAGVDLRTVQQLMGHKTITMTLRYSHLSPAHTLEAVNKLCPEPKRASTRTDTEETSLMVENSKSLNSWWSQQDSNLRPLACEASALTS